MHWPIFCWETLAPAIQKDISLTLNAVENRVHPFMESVFPYGSGLF